MLISHRKKFIFLKTAKTASTSVEAFFESWCLPEGEWEISHARPEYCSESGIIGERSVNARNASWWNHMPADQIKNRIGTTIWEEYFKFTVVRNPFDKMVSGFYFFEKKMKDWSTRKMLIEKGKKMLGRGSVESRIQGDNDIDRFRSWVKAGGAIQDRHIYTLNGKICVDTIIRYETLHDDINSVCQRLGIPYDISTLPSYKAGLRNKDIPLRDYYDAPTREIVEKRFHWELQTLGYEFPP